ncbi:MAG: AMP-binding protein, partial [Pseudomonadota bacterium]
MGLGIYSGLDRCAANYAPLTPLSFLARAADVFPDHSAIVDAATHQTWRETADRCRNLAAALCQLGAAEGRTVSILAPNVPAMMEAHFAVPMTGAVLNTINTRLDARAVAYILDHGESTILLVDPECAPLASEALSLAQASPVIIDLPDAEFPGVAIGTANWDTLAKTEAVFTPIVPADEFAPIALSYTSGTTGAPKGVVTHHRGAYLNAVSNVLAWDLGHHPRYLWTLPMFHCNGWCFPWTLAAVGGTAICLRRVREDAIFKALREDAVTHFCAAPIVLSMLANAPETLRAGLTGTVRVMTAAAPPPAALLQRMEAMGFDITHVYGLTETYGPSVVAAPQPGWGDLTPAARASVMARQGVRYPLQEGVMIADPTTKTPVPADGATIGEIFMRGNIVMMGYLKDRDATETALDGGWFATGDLGVMHPDGYLQIRDRSKDIIISGGENISSIEIEDVLYTHPDVVTAAVVARPDPRWGESPCAFVELRADA